MERKSVSPATHLTAEFIATLLAVGEPSWQSHQFVCVGAIPIASREVFRFHIQRPAPKLDDTSPYGGRAVALHAPRRDIRLFEKEFPVWVCEHEGTIYFAFEPLAIASIPAVEKRPARESPLRASVSPW